MRALAVAACVVFGDMNVYAENWPQWRGPRWDNVSQETDVPVTWSKTQNVVCLLYTSPSPRDA